MIRSLGALALIALTAAGCSGGSAGSDDGERGTPVGGSSKAVRFAECMRDNGVGDFPDPDAKGELTIDAVANDAAVDTETAAFEQAIDACRDLQPSGFTGRKRTPQQQEGALEFAACMRRNGVPDFPDPSPGGALIDTNRIPSAAGRGARDIPGFDAAVEACRNDLTRALGRRP